MREDAAFVPFGVGGTEGASPAQNYIINATGQIHISVFICPVEQFHDDALLSLFVGF